MSSSLVGKTLGNYKVVDTLGHGGMAAVYVGYQENVDRKVAIKVLATAMGYNPSFVERFQLEARTIARLQHPHILPLYDYGQQDDILYLVMAYVDGGTLEDLLDRGPLNLGRIEKILKEIAGALDYAHRQGIIHRDIKPANILLDGEGHALLADFGIVKLQESQGNLTGTGVVGTPAYMAPEQAQGLPVDHRADIYSLGVVIYELLSGRHPFTGDTVMQIMIKVMQEAPPDISTVTEGLPVALSAVIRKVLEKDPAERYQTATEFADAFSLAIGTGEREKIAASPQRSPRSADEEGTQRFTPPPTSARVSGMPTPSQSQFRTGQTDSQTVIVQQGISPLVLLGGIGIIALAVVVAVLLVVQGGNNDTPDTQSTLGASSSTQVVAVTDDPEPTDVPTTAPTPTPDVPAVPVFGQVSFGSNNGVGNTFSLSVQNLPQPPGGQIYEVWLANTADGAFVSAGELSLDPFGNGAFSYTAEDGQMLAATYNAVLISVEESMVESPTGSVRFSAQIPIEMTNALREIFVASENGLNGGSLFAGLLAEAQTGAQHAGLAAGSSNLGGVQTHSEHAINILRGEQEDLNGNGRGENPGRGVGVYTFLDQINSVLDVAINVADNPTTMGINAESMRICLENTQIRAREIEDAAHVMFTAASIEAVQAEIAQLDHLSKILITGEDLNESGQIDPFEGECGLDHVQTYSVLVSRMDLIEGDIISEE